MNGIWWEISSTWYDVYGFVWKWCTPNSNGSSCSGVHPKFKHTQMASKVRTFGTGNVIYVRWQVLFQVRCGCFLQGSTQAVSPLHFWVLFDITLGFQLTQPAKSPKSCTLYDITFRCISHINIYIMLYIYYIYILYIYIYITIFLLGPNPPCLFKPRCSSVFSIFTQWRCSPPWLAAGSRRWWCKPSRSPRRTSSPLRRPGTNMPRRQKLNALGWDGKKGCVVFCRMYWKVMKSLDVDWCLLMFLGVCWCLGNMKWSFGYVFQRAIVQFIPDTPTKQ